MSKKRIFTILLIIILLVIASFVGYSFFAKKEPIIITPGETPQPIPSILGGNVEVIDSKLRKISTEEATSPTISADSNKITYVGKKGGIFEMNFNGGALRKTKFITLPNLIQTSWNTQKTGFIGIYANPDGRKIFYYDIESKKSAAYDVDMQHIVFSPQGDSIAYHRFDTIRNENAIIIADLDGKNKKTIFQTRLKDVRLSWPSNDIIAVSTAPSGLAHGLLWALNPKTQKISSLLSNINGFTSKWAPKGEVFIFSKTDRNGKNLVLSSANINGSNITSLKIETLPEKCVFTKDAQRIICSVPQNNPDMIWPDEYYQNLYETHEEIWEINIKGSSKQMLYDFKNSVFDVSYPILSQDEKTMVFLNRKDNQIYSLEL